MSKDALRQKIEDRFGWSVYRACAGFAAVTVLLVVLADIFMWIRLDGYNPIDQTISAAAAGPSSGVLDTALVLLSLGVLALCVAFISRSHEGRLATATRAAFVVLTFCLVPLAVWNGYGDGTSEGMWLHKLLTAGVFLPLPVILWCAPAARPAAPDREILAARILAVALLVLGPLFFVVPDGVQGLYERGLAVIALATVLIAAWQFYCEPERQNDEG